MTDLRLEHRIPRERSLVEATLLAPGFASELARACPALSGVRPIRYEARGDSVERVTRFAARSRRLGSPFGWLPVVAWVERVRWSRADHEAVARVTPELPGALARRVRCEGTYRLIALDDGATLRRVEVSLDVRAPLVARAAEARLAALLSEIFDAEAALLGRSDR